MYSTHNEGKSVIAERFIRTLKNKIYKHMTSISKNAYIDKLDNIVNEYNNTYHRTTKLKPVDVNSGNYTEYNVNSNYKDPKFKLVIMQEYQNTKTFLLKDILQTGLKNAVVVVIISMIHMQNYVFLMLLKT